jgi:hypothetical protein
LLLKKLASKYRKFAVYSGKEVFGGGCGFLLEPCGALIVGRLLE